MIFQCRSSVKRKIHTDNTKFWGESPLRITVPWPQLFQRRETGEPADRRRRPEMRSEEEGVSLLSPPPPFSRSEDCTRLFLFLTPLTDSLFSCIGVNVANWEHLVNLLQRSFRLLLLNTALVLNENGRWTLRIQGFWQ